MAEYIERSFALDVVKRTSGDYVAAWAEIAHAPAADVAPVVHGRWESTGLISCKCSVCQHLELKGSMEYLYCPHCGAKMDKEDEDL